MREESLHGRKSVEVDRLDTAQRFDIFKLTVPDDRRRLDVLVQKAVNGEAQLVVQRWNRMFR